MTPRRSPLPAPLPAPLAVAASLVAVEALLLLLLAVLELASISTERLTLGLTTAGFFLIFAAALAGCAWGLARLRSWARSPVVLTQLIALGMAWSLRGASAAAAVGLAVVALVVGAGVLHPASIDALSGPAGDER